MAKVGTTEKNFRNVNKKNLQSENLVFENLRQITHMYEFLENCNFMLLSFTFVYDFFCNVCSWAIYHNQIVCVKALE